MAKLFWLGRRTRNQSRSNGHPSIRSTSSTGGSCSSGKKPSSLQELISSCRSPTKPCSLSREVAAVLPFRRRPQQEMIASLLSAGSFGRGGSVRSPAQQIGSDFGRRRGSLFRREQRTTVRYRSLRPPPPPSSSSSGPAHHSSHHSMASTHSSSRDENPFKTIGSGASADPSPLRRVAPPNDLMASCLRDGSRSRPGECPAPADYRRSRNRLNEGYYYGGGVRDLRSTMATWAPRIRRWINKLKGRQLEPVAVLLLHHPLQIRSSTGQLSRQTPRSFTTTGEMGCRLPAKQKPVE